MLPPYSPKSSALVHDYQHDLKLKFDNALAYFVQRHWNRHQYRAQLSPRFSLSLHRVREYVETDKAIDLAHLRTFLHLAGILKVKPRVRLSDMGVHHLFDPKLRAALADGHLSNAMQTVINIYNDDNADSVLIRTPRIGKGSTGRTRKTREAKSNSVAAAI